MAKPLMGLGDDRQCFPIAPVAGEGHSTGEGDAIGEGASTSELTIQGSVGRGGRNDTEDTRRIQGALNKVPSHEGGPQPSLVPDGLVGPITTGAIYKFQSHHFGPSAADGRVDPGHRTIAKLRAFQPGGQAAGGAAFGFATTAKKSLVPVMTQVQAALPVALLWVGLAIQRLAEAELKLKNAPGPDFTASLQLVNRCFMVNGLSQGEALKAIGKIRTIFNAMRDAITISMKVSFFHEAPGGGGCSRPGLVINAWTFPGGFKKRDANGVPPMSQPEYPASPDVPQNGIYMCVSNISNKNRDHLVDLIIHELAHFVGPAVGSSKIEDHAGGLKALKLTHDKAMSTAANYAWLAWLARLPMPQWLTNNG